MRTLNLICAVEGSAYFSRCPKDTGVIRNARPMKSPTPLRNDNTVAAHGGASAVHAKISLWSKAQTSASKAKVSASVFQSTRRKGGVKIWLAEASAASSIRNSAPMLKQDVEWSSCSCIVACPDAKPVLTFGSTRPSVIGKRLVSRFLADYSVVCSIRCMSSSECPK
jgi:hypothetical protein